MKADRILVNLRDLIMDGKHQYHTVASTIVNKIEELEKEGYVVEKQLGEILIFRLKK